MGAVHKVHMKGGRPKRSVGYILVGARSVRGEEVWRKDYDTTHMAHAWRRHISGVRSDT
jgi:hypothetical protein